jgi:hypothetical protein
MVTRDASGDEEDKPLRLEIIPPKKPPTPKKPEPEKVGVGAKQGEGDEHGHGDVPDAPGGDAGS